MNFSSLDNFGHLWGGSAEKDAKRTPPGAAPGAHEAARTFDSLGRDDEFVRSPFYEEFRAKNEQKR